MKVLQILPNSHYQNNYSQRTSFRGYTSKEICADLCHGACCDHGTVMNAKLKIIADKLYTSYKMMADGLKSTLLIKSSIVKWVVNSENPEVQTLNKLANTYIDAISKETDSGKIKQLEELLTEINKKLKQLIGDSELFTPVTNPELKDKSFFEVQVNAENICMFKDRGTNLCAIYDGIKDESGEIVSRPMPCHKVGSDEAPCPWHNPEKYPELCYRTKARLENNGYVGIPMQVVQKYVADQYNLNEVFIEKIWQPFLKTLEK